MATFKRQSTKLFLNMYAKLCMNKCDVLMIYKSPLKVRFTLFCMDILNEAREFWMAVVYSKYFRSGAK